MFYARWDRLLSLARYMPPHISFFFISLCILQIFVLLDEQRVTLKAEVDPSLIEQNKEEFIRLQNTIYC